MTSIQDNFLKELNDNNLFLSHDKMSATYAGGESNVTSNLKIKIKNNRFRKLISKLGVYKYFDLV